VVLLPIFSAPVLVAAETPRVQTSPDEINRLIDALGNADYYTRQQAESDLGKIGFEAVDALTVATEKDDLEIATRANRLLFKIRSNWVVPGEPSGVSQLLADYESQDDSSREDKVPFLIGLPDNQGIPAVCRIIRYERSLVVAKTAAVRLLEALANQTIKPDLAALLQRSLDGCRRLPARWVIAWLQARQDPRELASLWTRLAGDEEGLLLRQPRDTALPIVEGLLRSQIAALRRIDSGADATSSIERLIKLRHNEPDGLAQLLNWLTDQKDWRAMALVENRCQATIAASADLLYLVAEGQMRRGDATAAEASARQALRLSPDSDEPSLETHFQMGEKLEQRGRLEWAAKEWEHVINRAQPRARLKIAAARLLAELYHDREEDDRAAETLGAIEKAYATRSDQWPLFHAGGGDVVTLGTLRARLYYYDACLWKLRGDGAKQREYLDKALATQSYDIEVLIECYHVADPPADYRKKIRKLIEKQLCQLREQVADLGPHDSADQPCNEFAWLVANTEGDLDEALRFSKRSLELAGENGAYHDTLARVYFAKGEYASAVKHQARAAELLPNNRAVQKQLTLFRKTAAEKGEKHGKSQQGDSAK
jgi:tetratricopeptide (TPR) repeat protein